MTFDLATLFALGFCYLLMLFGVAFATEKGWIPAKVTRHPIVYVLSLGVFASVWSYYSATGSAFRDGYGYLAPFIGVSLAFLFSPLLLRPILDITKSYQLSSLADLLAFRYRSPLAGTLTTLVLLVGVMPLLSLQIQAVADTVGILAPEAPQRVLAFTFCVVINVFAILFGTGPGSGRQKHEGLVMAIAFESVVKLVALLCVGLFAVYGGFGGFDAMEEWLAGQPELLSNLKEPSAPGSFHVTAILFFTAAVAMPHMFYMAFNANNDPRALNLASWALPLYFLLLSLPILPILWAGLQAGQMVQVEYLPVTLGLLHGSELFTFIGFIGGLSAASGLIIVITLALSNMCLNHLILPVYQPTARSNIYRWLLWKRRVLITALVWGGFMVYFLHDDESSIQAIGYVAFIASLQFLPSIVALLYWPRGNRKGFIAGLAAGIAIWFLFLMLPVLSGYVFLSLGLNLRELVVLSLVCNIILFVLVSLFSRSSDEERASADICSLDTLRRRNRTGLVARSPQEFINKLTRPLGTQTATREVLQALDDLKFARDEKRPYAMRLLRGRLEANLSGLLGPTIAHELIDRFLPYTIESQPGATDLNIIESRIEAYRSNLSGMAADLDNLRRYHRQVLLDLPLGVCALGAQNQIVMWNRKMEEMTGIASQDVAGCQLNEIEEPWCSLIYNFTVADSVHLHKQAVEIDGRRRAVNLHRSVIEKSSMHKNSQDGVIILLEDLTETELLEEELTHSERLASIGRLAAEIAHEIGNPITGIACLAQNIRDETVNDEIREMARQIIEQTDRTSRIVQSLVNFAHSGSNKPRHNREVVHISECVREAIALISLDKKAKNINYQINCEPNTQILGDSQRLLQVMVNLINNAQDASPAESTITISCGPRDGGTDESWVQVTVEDEGSGIPEAIRDRVFDPFFTTKEPGEGTGLGLALVYSIVEDLCGHIEISNVAGSDGPCGTRVMLTFPCYDGEISNHQNFSSLTGGQ